MKTVVVAIWCLIGYAAFLASVYTLNDLGATPKMAAPLGIGLLVLGYATWRAFEGED